MSFLTNQSHTQVSQVSRAFHRISTIFFRGRYYIFSHTQDSHASPTRKSHRSHEHHIQDFDDFFSREIYFWHAAVCGAEEQCRHSQKSVSNHNLTEKWLYSHCFKNSTVQCHSFMRGLSEFSKVSSLLNLLYKMTLGRLSSFLIFSPCVTTVRVVVNSKNISFLL